MPSVWLFFPGKFKMKLGSNQFKSLSVRDDDGATEGDAQL